MIVIPTSFEAKLNDNPKTAAAVKKTIQSFDSWISSSTLTFFPEYTDHGPVHISSVLETARQLIPENSFELLTPEDIGALVIATILHDSALHLSADGFRRLVSGKTSLVPLPKFNDLGWGTIWESYRAESARFSPAENIRLYGEGAPVEPPNVGDWNWNAKQNLLVGEFIRRYHPRLAHQIALGGFPGAKDEGIRIDPSVSRNTTDLIGLIARSHGMPLRPCLDYLMDTHENRIDPEGIHALYLMVLLRVADYLQIDAARAPETRIRMQALRSQLSIHEWKKHHAVPQLTYDEKDPEARYIWVNADSVDSIVTYLSLKHLIEDIQRELDDSWAILGEVYGRLKEKARPLNQLGLTIRRLRTNLSTNVFLRKLPFRPEAVRFQSSDAKLFELLIEPLYGPNTEAGVRELVQNAVDAVRELEAYCQRHALPLNKLNRRELDADVTVDLQDISGEQCLVVSDRGVGMTLEIVRDYFLKVGASYRTSSAWTVEFADAKRKSNVLRTGYFGVGALAAFLIGDNVRVTTRHVTALEGLEFTASLQTDVIQINRADCPVGTKITIPVRAELVEKNWNPHLRYFLAKPTVRVNGALPHNTQPDIDDLASPHWQRLTSSDGPVVFWHRGGQFADRVVHNGFMVEHGDQELRSLWSDQWYGLRVLLPPLHILDRDGNHVRPYLNLARSEFHPTRFEPLDGIFADVLRDYLAFLLVTTPEDVDQINLAAGPEYRYIECLAAQHNLGFKREHPFCAPVVYTQHGVVPFDARILASLGISSLYFLNGGSAAHVFKKEPSAGILRARFASSHTFSMLYPKAGLDTAPVGLNVVASAVFGFEGTHLKHSGHTNSADEEISKLDADLAATFATHPTAGEESLIVRWILGSPDKLPELTIVQAVARAFAASGVGPGESPLKLAWSGLLGDWVIPYNLSDRNRKHSKAIESLGPHIEAWKELNQDKS